ncbi:hypothetical protein [Methylobacterium sp. Leaf88]|uniref:hypothetical protein n=1 Tax=Methylobacterium sp. Leaf88 TaxID=1736244 RepID=UPI001AEC1BFC|nr:hypothetical protein [Methylobacterium sp. Leaf88]
MALGAALRGQSNGCAATAFMMISPDRGASIAWTAGRRKTSRPLVPGPREQMSILAASNGLVSEQVRMVARLDHQARSTEAAGSMPSGGFDRCVAQEQGQA